MRHRRTRLEGSAFGCALTATLLAVSVAGFIAACATPGPTAAALPPGGAITVDAVPVPLNPANPAQNAIGDFTFAGGIALTTRDTPLLHGLSDVIVSEDAHLTAVGDDGIFFDAQLEFGPGERLAGLRNARIVPLRGEDGRPLSGKLSADAEGLTQLPNGDRLVSFERRHRIWLYPAGGGPPRAVPSPQVSFPLNAGMEALAADPESAADAYIVGGEESGEMWSCRVSQAECQQRPMIAKPPEFGLVGMATLPGGRLVQLLRAYEQRRGTRVTLRIFTGTTEVARMEIAPPLTIDNFEGVAAVPRGDGRTRFYLLSDDNGSDSQRTLLLAFDWRPR
jgi:hypothetical protein